MRTPLPRAACSLLVLAALASCGPGATGAPDTLRLAHVYEVTAPTHECGAAPLARELEAAGEPRVQVFPGAQLGNEAELLEQLVTGQLDLAIAGPSFLAAWHEPIGVLDAAYLFEDLDHQRDAARSALGQQLWDGLREAHGIRVLDNWAYGERHVTSRRPIRHPDDLRGFRLRLPHARVWQESGRALGASPMPIAFSEVYLALQQGIADGQENPVVTIKTMGFHEVQTHLNLTGHSQASTQLVMADRVWTRLDDGARSRLAEAARRAGDRVRDCIEEADARILQEWRTAGTMQIVDDVDRQAFRERARRHFADGFVWSELYARIQRREY